MILQFLGRSMSTETTDNGYTVTVTQTDLLATLKTITVSLSTGYVASITLCLVALSYYLATVFEKKKDLT